MPFNSQLYYALAVNINRAKINVHVHVICIYLVLINSVYVTQHAIFSFSMFIDIMSGSGPVLLGVF